MFILKKISSLKILNDETKLERFFSLIIIIAIPINLIINRGYGSTWTVGEWLISYAGGFVRRGLPGEIIYKISNNFNLPPIFLVHTISSLSLIALSIILMRFSKNLFNKSLLLSQLMLMSPLAGNYFIRKDAFLLSIFGFCLMLLKKFYQKKVNPVFLITIINLLSIVAILSHEMYGIWALPSIFFIIYLIFRERNRNIFNSFIKAILSIFPSLISFWFCWEFEGDYLIALKIHQSWQGLDRLIYHLGPLDSITPKGAIAAIGWGKDQIFANELLDDFSKGFIWIPAIWLLTIFVVMQLFIGSKGDFNRKVKRNIICIQFIPVAPMFLMIDYGRWIFIWITTSALLLGFINQTFGFDFLNKKINKLFNYKMISKITPGFRSKGIYNLFLIFTGIPHCCWTLHSFITTSPVGFFINTLYLYYLKFLKFLF